jgi:hypothetical protein
MFSIAICSPLLYVLHCYIFLVTNQDIQNQKATIHERNYYPLSGPAATLQNYHTRDYLGMYI